MGGYSQLVSHVLSSTALQTIGRPGRTKGLCLATLGRTKAEQRGKGKLGARAKGEGGQGPRTRRLAAGSRDRGGRGDRGQGEPRARRVEAMRLTRGAGEGTQGPVEGQGEMGAKGGQDEPGATRGEPVPQGGGAAGAREGSRGEPGARG